MQNKEYLNENETRVVGYLMRNPNEWLAGHIIAYQCGINSKLTLRKAIQTLRAMGTPIIADTQLGYKYTTIPSEIKSYCDARRRELTLELNIINTMEGSLSNGNNK